MNHTTTNRSRSKQKEDVSDHAAKVLHHLSELQKRQLGNFFGGPDPSWCAPVSKEAILLPANPEAVPSNVGITEQPFSGCLKYTTCNLIPDNLRWKRWDQMSQKEQEELRQLRCYRATRQEWAWDTKALASRQGAGNQDRWIANPFGVRTKQLGKRAKQLADEASRVGKVFDPREHRDLSPCPVGGCVTPEMQRDYVWDLSHKGKLKSASDINWGEACQGRNRMDAKRAV